MTINYKRYIYIRICNKTVFHNIQHIIYIYNTPHCVWVCVCVCVRLDGWIFIARNTFRNSERSRSKNGIVFKSAPSKARRKGIVRSRGASTRNGTRKDADQRIQAKKRAITRLNLTKKFIEDRTNSQSIHWYRFITCFLNG